MSAPAMGDIKHLNRCKVLFNYFAFLKSNLEHGFLRLYVVI
jgi:hypothetical protein